jgi:transcriptional regulator with XRE-family HTH domain
MPASALELSTLGHRIRHHRVAHALTLDELGAIVGVAGSQLSLIENGKREPKLSLLQAIAQATGTDVTDLLSPEPPNRRAALELDLERAQGSPVFRRLGIPPVRVTKTTSDETIEAVLGLHRELQRREREAIATPEEARRANTELRLRMRERNNYLPEIEQLAEKQLRAAGHTSGALTHRTVSIMAQQLGFELIYVDDLPHSARSVTDLENGRIYLPPASIPGGHGLRSMALQAMAHRLLGHTPPTDYADFLSSASRSTTTRHAACCRRPRRSPSSAGEEGPQPRRRGLPRRVRRDARGAAMRMTNLLTSASACTSCASTVGRDHPRLRERRPAAADGCHRIGRGPDRVPQVRRARRIRRAEPHRRALPVHRHARRDVLVLEPDRQDRTTASSRSPSACPSTTPAGSAVVRPRSARRRPAPTKRAAAGRMPAHGPLGQQGLAERARAHADVLAAAPRRLPGVDDNEVYSFLDRHAAQ